MGRKQNKLRRLLRKWDDPILKQVCEPVKFGEDIREVVRTMQAVLAACPTGVGLAAPQIGVAKRIILIRDQVLVNPTFEPYEDAGKVTDMEGCLSYPDVTCFVERWKSIHIRSLEFSGDLVDLPARIAQHEIDHLSGVCLVGDSWRKTLWSKYNVTIRLQ